MKKYMTMLTAIAAMAIPVLRADSTTTLDVTVAAEASISVSPTVAFAHTGSTFGDFTGSTSFTYRMRTTATGGSGSITATAVQFQTNGPQIGTDQFKYTSSTDLTPAPTVQTGHDVSTSSFPVINFGTDTHADGAGGTIVWTLTDNPAWKTGNYTSLVTLTISAS